MAKLCIEGKHPLEGEIDTHGAKNSALPILAATILSGKETILHNCPKLSDVEVAGKILKHLGAFVSRDGNTVTVDSSGISQHHIPDSLMREMRSSIIFLGPILAKQGEARLSFPGGCELGPRPIDLHLFGLKALGAKVEEEGGELICSCGKGLCGAAISLSFPSVGATENIMLAATLAKGTTIISNAAREPEIVDLANYLNESGAKISGAGEGTITIEGVPRLDNCEHSVIPDRIWVATFLCCAAASRGEILIKKANPAHLQAVIPYLEQLGCQITCTVDTIHILSPRDRMARMTTVRTMPYPGFPTDAEAPLMAVAAYAEGTSIFVENIFDNRYRQVSELRRMGANIRVEGKVAIIEGVPELYGAEVMATDLRGGASLVVAALGAEGTTYIDNIFHIDRGYEEIETCLKDLGAKIKRM